MMHRLRRLRIYLGCKRSDDIGIFLHVSMIGYPFLGFRGFNYEVRDVFCRTQKGPRLPTLAV